MRFAAAVSRPSESRARATEPDRPTAGADEGKPAEAQPETKKTTELPLDLDQRVRLVGEW